jgi:mono/diheme cytochrome c family protein
VRRAATLTALLLGLALAGCGGDDDGDEATPPPPPPPAETGDTGGDTGGETSGEAVFASAGCGSCHTFTPAGSSGTIGPNLDETSVSVEQAEEQVRNGGGAMPPFGDELSDAEITAVAEYVAGN